MYHMQGVRRSQASTEGPEGRYFRHHELLAASRAWLHQFLPDVSLLTGVTDWVVLTRKNLGRIADTLGFSTTVTLLLCA